MEFPYFGGFVQGDVQVRSCAMMIFNYQDRQSVLGVAARFIAVVDMGRVIARGTSDELKAQVGGERIELTVARGGNLDAAVEALRPYSSGTIQVNSANRHLIVPVTQGAQILTSVVRDLGVAQIPLDDLALRRPTLDDVFLALTGRTATSGELSTDEETLAARPVARSSAR